MNHVNWVQQNEDYNVKYHVLKWKTSHFHEPYANHASTGTKVKLGGAAPMAAVETQKEGEGIGFGLAQRGGDARLRLGFGLEESLAGNISGGKEGRDGVSLSARGMAGQDGVGETARAALQSMALAEIHAAENTVTAAATDGPAKEKRELERAEKENTTVSESGRGNIRNRLRESAARLREAYQRQKKKTAKLSLRQIHKEEPKKKKGTRQAADRETMLSMQAENHYLLDSYDATGNYSMLGKK
ncbi:MAG: hypothetical protein K2I53_00280 [Lachnospiraceae bacterium]|nr:hypothetical protein [Lachnospiraceae bacterium]